MNSIIQDAVEFVLICLYTIVFIQSIIAIKTKLNHPEEHHIITRVLTLLSLSIHFYVLSEHLSISEHNFKYSFIAIISLFFLFCMLSLLILDFFYEVQVLNIFIVPILILVLVMQLYDTNQQTMPLAIATHILPSAISYGFIMLSFLQAIFLKIQERNFKSKNFSNLYAVLPPLQTMKLVLLLFIKLGFFFLTLSLISGYIFIDNIFIQHLSHKIFFAIISWIIYAVILFLNYSKKIEIKFLANLSIAAWVCLCISYFITKIILEIIGR